VVDAGPGGGELAPVRVLGVAAARVHGDAAAVMTRPAQRPHQRPRVALVGDHVHVARSTV